MGKIALCKKKGLILLSLLQAVSTALYIFGYQDERKYHTYKKSFVSLYHSIHSTKRHSRF